MDSQQPRNILVIRFSSLGDVVLTTAILPNLKAKWPGAKVTVATKSHLAAVFDRNPHVDRVMIFDGPSRPFSQLATDVRREHWDIVIDLHANPRSWFLRLVAGGGWTVVVDKASAPRWALLFTKRASEKLKRSVRDRILDTLRVIDVPVVSDETQLFPVDPTPVLNAWGAPTEGALIGIAPGARHATKRWPAAKFAEAANRLGAMPKSTVLILGDRADKAVAAEVASNLTVPHVNLAGKTSLTDLIAVTSRLSFLLTNDSALLHIGEALKIPLVSLWGPTVRAFGFGPYRPTSRVAEVVNLHCRPCTLHGDERCPLGHHKCMEDIDVNAVLYVASDLLESVGRGPM
jgi:lipopolysaccharide heptosyltransferase II